MTTLSSKCFIKSNFLLNIFFPVFLLHPFLPAVKTMTVTKNADLKMYNFFSVSTFQFNLKKVFQTRVVVSTIDYLSINATFNHLFQFVSRILCVTWTIMNIICCFLLTIFFVFFVYLRRSLK